MRRSGVEVICSCYLNPVYSLSHVLFFHHFLLFSLIYHQRICLIDIKQVSHFSNWRNCHEWKQRDVYKCPWIKGIVVNSFHNYYFYISINKHTDKRSMGSKKICEKKFGGNGDFCWPKPNLQDSKNKGINISPFMLLSIFDQDVYLSINIF